VREKDPLQIPLLGANIVYKLVREDTIMNVPNFLERCNYSVKLYFQFQTKKIFY